VLKHFAGDLLATLAGQDQLQGEGSNNMHASARFKVALAVTIMVCAEAGQSISAEPASSGGQPELDLIAGVPFDITFKQLGAPMPPGPFSSWTADQQRSVPADLQKLCAGFWTFINGADGTPTRFSLSWTSAWSDTCRPTGRSAARGFNLRRRS
jgi:hypothetical protein